MGLVSRKSLIERECNDLLPLLKQLKKICSYDNKKTIEDLRSVALLGSSMEDLKKNPKEAMNVLLPMIMSFAEKDSLFRGEDRVFQEVIDILLTEGIDACIQRVEELKR